MNFRGVVIFACICHITLCKTPGRNHNKRLSPASELPLGQDEEVLLAQVVFRHGAKVPDLVDPRTKWFWDSYGQDGETIQLGVDQMYSLGKTLHERYVGRVWPEDFNRRVIKFRSSPEGTDRPLQSAFALASALYPSAAVPIATASRGDERMLVSGNCPSFDIERPKMDEIHDLEMTTTYADLLSNFTALTGYADEGISLRPAQLREIVYDNLENNLLIGYPDIPEYFLDNFDLLYELQERFLHELVVGTHDDLGAVRGTPAGVLMNEILANIEAALSGSELKGSLYSGHSTSLQFMYIGLGIGMKRPDIASAFTLEVVRDRGSGQIFVRGSELVLDTESEDLRYLEVPTPLPCADGVPSDACPIGDFTSYVRSINAAEPYSTGVGCCFRTLPDFTTVGCGDFLNPDVLDISQCTKYRQLCPGVSCDDDQVVDAETLLCVGAQRTEL